MYVLLPYEYTSYVQTVQLVTDSEPPTRLLSLNPKKTNIFLKLPKNIRTKQYDLKHVLSVLFGEGKKEIANFL